MLNLDFYESDNPKEAFRIAVNKSPEFIIIDYFLLNYNGIPFTSLLRTHSSTTNSKIIILSSFPLGTDDMMNLKRDKIELFLIKPYEVDVLFNKFFVGNNFEKSLDFKNSEKNNFDRRDCSRFNVFNHAELEVNGKKYNARIKNMSKNGLKVIIKENVDVGSNLNVYMTEKNNSLVTGQAKLMWIKQDNSDTFTAGIEFQNVKI